MIKPYCVQNNGDCKTCSLVSYNRDCANNPLHGGKRPGAGRKPTNRKPRLFRATDQEWKQIVDNAANAQMGTGEFIRTRCMKVEEY